MRSGLLRSPSIAQSSGELVRLRFEPPVFHVCINSEATQMLFRGAKGMVGDLKKIKL